jgi:polyisoprenoid-binding protein YceI
MRFKALSVALGASMLSAAMVYGAGSDSKRGTGSKVGSGSKPAGSHAKAHSHDNYVVDTTHARVGFSIDHLMISKVQGAFKDYEASLHMHGGTLASATAVIKVASVDTGNKKRDQHLLAPDFFDAAKYPTITFKSKSVKGKDILIGDLTIRDVTKEVELKYTVKGPVKDPWGNTKVGFQGSCEIDRTEYGLTYSAAMEAGGLVVGKMVTLQIDLEAAKK